MQVERILYKLMRPFISFFFICFDRFCPKDGNLWVFPVGVNGRWCDNIRFVYDEAVQRDLIRCVILYVPGDKNLPSGATCVPRLSLKGLFLLWRCGVIFVHHGPLDHYFKLSDSSRQIINLWHAITLKNIGIKDLALHSTGTKRRIISQAAQYSWTVVSSTSDAEALRHCYKLPKEAVKVTGLPRNDILFCDDADMPADMQAALSRQRSWLKGRRLVAYVPTWRSTTDDDYIVPALQRDRIQNVLTENNAVLGIKAHPNSLNTALGRPGEFFKDLCDAGSEEIGVLLRAASVIVTDYSSIWADYLLLNRPIVGFCYDFDHYRTSRGFAGNYEALFPGPLNLDVDAFISDLAKVLDRPLSVQRIAAQQEALAHFHKYRDGQNSRRVIDTVLNVRSRSIDR
ncbi:CDP-glycerol glycerophosphotransferase family protein [bacterium]|nr:CDP-glycerol glycerophosphotransferase family protein [bacterium]